MTESVDPELLRFASPRYREVLELLIETGSAAEVVRRIGCHRSYPGKALAAVKAQAAKAQAARQGHAPGHWDSGTAPGYHMGKVTVQRGPEGVERNWERQIPDGDAPAPKIPEGHTVGRITVQRGERGIERAWERYEPDDRARQEAFKAAAEALAATLPRVAPIAPPSPRNERLCTVYTLTDAHIGMLAWRREGGADWDLRIAEETIIGCLAEEIRSTPCSEVAILNQLGDLLHYDGLAAVTPTSGHILDADGRFTKMVEVAVRVLRRAIDMILAKHARLHLILAEGNHDIASSVWLRTMFKALYENEPRITVDDSALPYYAYQHGNVMLAFHHSHLKKFAATPGFFAAQFSVMWGATTKRYAHTGNLHHAAEKEDGGMKIIQHPTIAARDAYAARGGWFAMRAMTAMTYDIEYGEVGRVTVCPEMLEAA